MLGAAASNQTGAGIGALAFDVLGPVGVVAVRQWVAGVLLLALTRPRLRSYLWPQWWPVLLLAMVFAAMNLSLYSAVDRVGLGTAVTLEFLGPLAVALVRSRRPVDVACAVLAGAGVVVLVRPEPSTDVVGVGLGLLAAASWAGYIVLNRVVGSRVPGAAGPALASAVSGTALLPVGAAVLLRAEPTLLAVACAAAAGVLSSAVPFVLDMLALRRVRAGYFGLFMSVHPVLAAAVGLVLLGQVLPWTGWLGIGAVVSANVVAAWAAGRGDVRVPVRDGLCDRPPAAGAGAHGVRVERCSSVARDR